MANRKLGKAGNLGNLGKIIPSFLIAEFSILAVRQNRKLGFKNLGKKLPRFPRFLSFDEDKKAKGKKKCVMKRKLKLRIIKTV